MKVELTRDEINDIISALQFFEESYPDRKGSVITRKAMKKVCAKLWKYLRGDK